MNEVVIEGRQQDGTWRRIGGVAEIEPPGSLSSVSLLGSRDVIIFGWHAGDGPKVWRSVKGIDIENPAIRAVISEGLEVLADLQDGPHEMDIWMTRQPLARPVRVRFRAVPTGRVATVHPSTEVHMNDETQGSDERLTGTEEPSPEETADAGLGEKETSESQAPDFTTPREGKSAAGESEDEPTPS